MILTVTFSLDNIDLINKNQTGNHNVVFSYINDIRKKKDKHIDCLPSHNETNISNIGN